MEAVLNKINVVQTFLYDSVDCILLCFEVLQFWKEMWNLYCKICDTSNITEWFCH